MHKRFGGHAFVFGAQLRRNERKGFAGNEYPGTKDSAK